MIIPVSQLKSLTSAIFHAAGCSRDEADGVARHLVESNLVGHDSHGVIRIPTYIDWLLVGKVLPNRSLEVVFENETIAVVDGCYGLGQTIGEQAVRMGMEKVAHTGVSVIALRNSGHLGRIGDWPEMAAREGFLSLHFVNTSGMGMLVAPFGGIQRRLSACPIAAGIPVQGGEPMVLDISMCTIAEGKIRVALNKGIPVPDHCLIDSQGQPTNDPRVFYGSPPGAILPIAGHKGYGLGILAEVLAGALTGSSCTNPANASRLTNGMLSIYLDHERFLSDQEFSGELARFIEFVRSSEKDRPEGQILMPGEIEQQTKARRLSAGIELDETTWGQIRAVCEKLQVPLSPLPS